jgi:hypothetical protein
MKSLDNRAYNQHQSGGDEQSNDKRDRRLVRGRHRAVHDPFGHAEDAQKDSDRQQERDENHPSYGRASGLAQPLVNLLTLTGLTTALAGL